MAKENIRIRYEPAAAGAVVRDPWKAQCEFVFENTSKAAVKLLMGFPDNHVHADGAKPNDWSIRNFKVLVDGKEVQPEHKEIERKYLAELPKQVQAQTLEKVLSKDGFDGAYVWSVEFPPKAHASSIFWMKTKDKRDGWAFANGTTKTVSYIVKTALTWSGPVGEADIRFEFPSDLFPWPHLVIPVPAKFTWDRTGISWHLKNWTPESDIYLHQVDPIPNEGREYPPVFDSAEQARAWVRFLNQGKVDPAVVLYVRDLVYAKNGHVFTDQERKAMLMPMGDWYKPKRALTASELPKEDRMIVQVLDEYARKLANH